MPYIGDALETHTKRNFHLVMVSNYGGFDATIEVEAFCYDQGWV